MGHLGVVAVRARVLAAYMVDFHPAKTATISECTFRIVDGVVLVAALILVSVGTVRCLSVPRWRLLLVLPVLAVQFFAAFLLYVFLGMTVHLAFGGPL